MEKREKKNDSIFQHRLERHHDELRWLYMELYQNGDMFAELCSQMYEYYNCRRCFRQQHRGILLIFRKPVIM